MGVANVDDNSMLKIEVKRSMDRINYYNHMLYYARFPNERFYYGELIRKEKMRIDYLRRRISVNKKKEERYILEREFTLEELAEYDGSGGKPAYVAIDGIVYDVSLEPTWGGATHFSLYAGKDLTEEFKGCHGRIEVLRNLPKVGILKEG